MSGWATIRDSVGKTINLGRQNKANSLPVTMASDQDAIAVSGTVAVSNLPATQPVSATSLPLPANAAQETGGVLATISTAIATIAGAITGAAMKVVLQAGANVIGAVTQSGTWTVQPGNTANTTAWKVDGSAVTQPVSGTFWQSTQPVQGVAGGTPVPAVGILIAPTASFTRPANTTAYASGQLVANSTTAGSVVPMSLTVARAALGNGFLRRVKLDKTGTSTTNASFRLHFYSSSPVASNGDGAAWLTTLRAPYIGAMDVTMDKVFGDGACGIGVPNTGNEIGYALASGQIVYVLIEARAAYAPITGEVFTVTLDDWQN